MIKFCESRILKWNNHRPLLFWNMRYHLPITNYSISNPDIFRLIINSKLLRLTFTLRGIELSCLLNNFFQFIQSDSFNDSALAANINYSIIVNVKHELSNRNQSNTYPVKINSIHCFSSNLHVSPKATRAYHEPHVGTGVPSFCKLAAYSNKSRSFSLLLGPKP
jgi:hypothetical protein